MKILGYLLFAVSNVQKKIRGPRCLYTFFRQYYLKTTVLSFPTIKQDHPEQRNMTLSLFKRNSREIANVTVAQL